MIERDCLAEEHRRVMAIADDLLEAVRSPEPRVDAAVALRWRMRRVLLAHLAKEDRLLYPLLQASADRAVADCARRFASEMGGLAAAYNRHMSDWPADRIAADWQRFRTETIAILEALAIRVGREDRELYPLIEGAQAASSRPPATMTVGGAPGHF